MMDIPEDIENYPISLRKARRYARLIASGIVWTKKSKYSKATKVANSKRTKLTGAKAPGAKIPTGREKDSGSLLKRLAANPREQFLS